MAPPSAACSLAAVPLSLALALVAAIVTVSSAADPDGAAQSMGMAHLLSESLPSELETDLQHALSEALGIDFRIHDGHMLAVQADLESMWRTTAKDAHGCIDHRSLRYMVQRYFRQKYHISIIGLEDSMEVMQVYNTSSAAEATLLAKLILDFVRSVLEQASAEAGFSLEDMAALVVVIEHLIEDSGRDNLESSYRARGFDITDLLSRDQLTDVMKHYMLRWAHGQDLQAIASREENRARFEEFMARWTSFMGLAKGHIQAFEHQHLHAAASGRAHGSGLKEVWNPMRPLFSFADAQAVISGISAQSGSFFETICENVMQDLLKNERRGTGRVPLSSFHGRALDGHQLFVESAEYLRLLGVLDESSFFHGPQVIASNYLQYSGNCVIAQKHFRVCCASPCHAIYSDLELAIGAPEGELEEVLALVSGLTYGLDVATPTITRKLRALLQEIAQANHGRIPLHGRLFAQWLHYVFPTECPFPRKASSISSLSAIEFGDDKLQATHAEMKANAQRGKAEAHAASNRSEGNESQQHSDDDVPEFMGMWSQEEELLSQRMHQSSPSPSTPPRLGSSTLLRRVPHALAAISAFVLVVLQPVRQMMAARSKSGFSEKSSQFV